jgi:predicted 2-oxoglutarate/Fe(II)-dependent dioxygenase YbiX
MSKLFVKDKIIPDYLFEDILYDLQQISEYKSIVSNGKNSNIDEKIRNSISKNLKPSEFLDLNKLLENYCQEFNSNHIPSTLMVKELEYLKYGISGHFRPHDDVLPNEKQNRIRRFTTVTLLSKTDDLEGGNLMVFDENKNAINTNLEVGETVLFYSSTTHQVTPITKGGREVLVAWIYDR